MKKIVTFFILLFVVNVAFAQYSSTGLLVGLPIGNSKNSTKFQLGLNGEIGKEFSKNFGVGLAGDMGICFLKKDPANSDMSEIPRFFVNAYVNPRINFGADKVVPFLALGLGGSFNSFSEEGKLGFFYKPTFGINFSDYYVSVYYANFQKNFPFVGMQFGYDIGHKTKDSKGIDEQKKILEEMDRKQEEKKNKEEIERRKV